MNNVPNWQALILIYIVVVAIPVFLIHARLKPWVLASKTPGRFLAYLAGVAGTAFLTHFISTWLYFRVLFHT